MSKQPAYRGISLVEVMVTLAVLGVLLGVAWPSMADMLSRRRVEAVAAELRSSLTFARSEAGLRGRVLDIWFKRDDALSCYTIGVGIGGGGCNCMLAPPASTCSGMTVEVKTVRVSSDAGVTLKPQSGDRLRFAWPQLTPIPNEFAVLVQGKRVGQLLISMNAAGRTLTCSPDQSMPGVKPCE